VVGAELLLHRAASWRVAVTQARTQSGVGSERDEPLDRGSVERSEFVELGAGFGVEAAVLVEMAEAAESTDHQGADVPAERFDLFVSKGCGLVEGE
jgi:hypothetical protein